jgi:hypothetical protein
MSEHIHLLAWQQSVQSMQNHHTSPILLFRKQIA